MRAGSLGLMPGRDSEVASRDPAGVDLRAGEHEQSEMMTPAQATTGGAKYTRPERRVAPW